MTENLFPVVRKFFNSDKKISLTVDVSLETIDPDEPIFNQIFFLINKEPLESIINLHKVCTC